ncbi:MAG: hypothetical protein H7315_05855 [Herminiimonas sp.]|nr:hypothetical protein [Herminiimonas sp.]
MSKIRNRKLPVGESFLLRSHEATDIPVTALRVLMGDRRKQLRYRFVQTIRKRVMEVPINSQIQSGVAAHVSFDESGIKRCRHHASAIAVVAAVVAFV